MGMTTSASSAARGLPLVHGLTVVTAITAMSLSTVAGAAEPPDKPLATKAESATPNADADKPGTTSAIVGGREVSVTAPDTTATVNVVGPTAEVRIGTRLLVVEKAQLTLDGKPLGPLPPDSRKVEVVLDKGGLVVKADGKESARAPMQDQPQ